MSTRPDRVRIWASQLEANRFPPVCAMTGRQADMWRRFKFETPPAWAYFLLFLSCVGGIGFIAYRIAVYAISRRAQGYLPLTRSSNRTVALLKWVPLGLLLGWFAAWLLWLIAATNQGGVASTVAFICAVLGIALLLCGLAGRLIVKPLVCPTAKVMEAPPGRIDLIVELRNVHPRFVASVHGMNEQTPGWRGVHP